MDVSEVLMTGTLFARATRCRRLRRDLEHRIPPGVHLDVLYFRRAS
jgi:hypothetical protein